MVCDSSAARAVTTGLEAVLADTDERVDAVVRFIFVDCTPLRAETLATADVELRPEFSVAGLADLASRVTAKTGAIKHAQEIAKNATIFLILNPDCSEFYKSWSTV